MYNLMIVDDEEIVLEGLKEHIPWGDMGFKCVASAQSIVEAMIKLEQNKINVILTDIVMDQETGFDLIEEVNKIYPNIKFVVLSGHNTFQYAVKAMGLGCISFLTKPIDFAETNRVFNKIFHMIEEENILDQNKTNLYKLKQENFFRKFLNEELSNEYLEKEFSTYLPGESPLYSVMGICILSHDKEEIIKSMEQLMGQDISKVFFWESTHIGYLIISGIKNESHIEKINDFLIKTNLKEKIYYISSSQYSRNLFDIPDLYKQAKIALRYRYTIDSDKVLIYDQISILYSQSILDVF